LDSFIKKNPILNILILKNKIWDLKKSLQPKTEELEKEIGWTITDSKKLILKIDALSWWTTLPISQKQEFQKTIKKDDDFSDNIEDVTFLFLDKWISKYFGEVDWNNENEKVDCYNRERNNYSMLKEQPSPSKWDKLNNEFNTALEHASNNWYFEKFSLLPESSNPIATDHTTLNPSPSIEKEAEDEVSQEERLSVGYNWTNKIVEEILKVDLADKNIRIILGSKIERAANAHFLHK
jgi:hypothetical protein